MFPGIFTRSVTTLLALATFFLVVTAQIFWNTIHGDGAVYAWLMREITEAGIFSLKLPLWTQTEIFADHPYLFFYVSSFFTKIFGYSDVAVKLPNFAIAAVSVYLLYRICRIRSGETNKAHAIGLIAGYVLIFNSNYIMQVSQPSLDPLAQILCLFAVVSFVYLKRSFISGLLLGFAFLTKGLEILPHVAAIALLGVYLKHKNLKDLLQHAGVMIAGVLIPVAGWLAMDQLAWQGEWLRTYWDRQFTHRFLEKSNMQEVFGYSFGLTLLRVYFLETVVLIVGIIKFTHWKRKSDPLFIYFLLYVFFNTLAFSLIKKDSSQHLTGTFVFGAVIIAEYLWDIKDLIQPRIVRGVPVFLFVVAAVYWGVYVVNSGKNNDVWTAIKREAPNVQKEKLPVVIDNGISDMYGIFNTSQWYFKPNRVYKQTEADRLFGKEVIFLSDADGKISITKRIYQR